MGKISPEAFLYRKLEVWRRGCVLTVRVYRATASFPDTARYVLIVQMRRCAVSIPSNVAEGAARRSPNDFRRYLLIAAASLAELETQCTIARMLRYLPNREYRELRSELKEIGRMLNGLRRSLPTPRAGR